MYFRTLFATLVLGASALVAQPARAQSAADHIAEGDKAYAAFDATTALTHYEAAIAADPTNYEALWKAARDAVDLGEAATKDDTKFAFYKKAQGYAQRAVAANPNDPEGHFHYARALGRTALALGVRDRIKYAKSVREQALAALKLDPKHAGANHVMGMWNAEVMRLNGFSRMIAKTFLGGDVFGEASWDKAVSYMQASVAADPNRPIHHYDLGMIYADMGNKAKARAELEEVVKLPRVDYTDPQFKAAAAKKLKDLD